MAWRRHILNMILVTTDQSGRSLINEAQIALDTIVPVSSPWVLDIGVGKSLSTL